MTERNIVDFNIHIYNFDGRKHGVQWIDTIVVNINKIK